MAKRLFVAIDLPESTRKSLAALDPRVRGVRWTDPAQMHLTLSFFGEVPDETDLALREKLSAIEFGAFFLPIVGVGAFSAKGALKIVWIGVGKALQGCFCAIASEVLADECRVRCRNDPRRSFPSLFQQAHTCGPNSHARTKR